MPEFKDRTTKKRTLSLPQSNSGLPKQWKGSLGLTKRRRALKQTSTVYWTPFKEIQATAKEKMRRGEERGSEVKRNGGKR